MDFGSTFSSQVMSSNIDAIFWLIDKLIIGRRR